MMDLIGVVPFKFYKLLKNKWSLRKRARVLFQRSYIEISENDYYRLLRSFARQKKAKAVKASKLACFYYMLSSGMLRAIRAINRNIVTMNTDLIVRTAADKKIQVRLVYPEHESKLSRYISVFSWTGMSLLGKKEGDKIRRGITIEEILYQPEHRNAFHL